MEEIKRILKPNGNLLARVNSISDLNYGAGQGQKIEKTITLQMGIIKDFSRKMMQKNFSQSLERLISKKQKC